MVGSENDFVHAAADFAHVVVEIVVVNVAGIVVVAVK